HLWERVAAQAVAGHQEVQASRRPGRAARVARLTVRFAEVELRRPKNCRHPKTPVRVWAVLAGEEQPPPGVDPLEWMLLTTKPVHSGEEAAEKTALVCAALADRGLPSHAQKRLPHRTTPVGHGPPAGKLSGPRHGRGVEDLSPDAAGPRDAGPAVHGLLRRSSVAGTAWISPPHPRPTSPAADASPSHPYGGQPRRLPRPQRRWRARHSDALARPATPRRYRRCMENLPSRTLPVGPHASAQQNFLWVTIRSGRGAPPPQLAATASSQCPTHVPPLPFGAGGRGYARERGPGGEGPRSPARTAPPSTPAGPNSRERESHRPGKARRACRSAPRRRPHPPPARCRR